MTTRQAAAELRQGLLWLTVIALALYGAFGR